MKIQHVFYQVNIFRFFLGKVTSLDLSQNGFWILACCRDDTLRLIDARTYQLVRTFQTEGLQLTCKFHIF